MTVPRKSKAVSAARPHGRASGPDSPDIVAVLEADHREVDELFARFDAATGNAEKKAVADQICLGLKVHAQLEEELLYPLARDMTGDGDLIDDAIVEHSGAKILVAQIEAMSPGQDLYDAKVRILGEQVRHHVQDEEQELFPRLREAKVDLKALGVKLGARKAQLLTLLAPSTVA